MISIPLITTMSSALESASQTQVKTHPRNRHGLNGIRSDALERAGRVARTTSLKNQSSKSFSGPRFARKKYAEAPITIDKNPTPPAISVTAPQSTRAPGTFANFSDATGAYPSTTCVYALPAGVIVHGARNSSPATPNAKHNSVTL